MENKQEILKRYAEIKAEISALETLIDEMKPDIVQIVEAANPEDHEVVTDFGTFTVVQKRKYTYTPDVIKKEEEVKQLKKEQEAKGEAEYTILPYLMFKAGTIE